MKATQLSRKTVLRAKERFEETLEQMSVEEANTMPAPLIKSVTWLVWHTARELDYQISDLKGTEPLWISQSWNEKFSLDLPDDTPDWRHTPEEAKKVVVKDKKLLFDYLNSSVAFTLEYLEQVDEATFDEVIDRNWTPVVTRQDRLVSILDDAFWSSNLYAKTCYWKVKFERKLGHAPTVYSDMISVWDKKKKYVRPTR